MKKFLVLYKAPSSAMEQMAKVSPEQAQSGMEAWMSWARKARSGIVDLGAPLGEFKMVANAEADNSKLKTAGYSILQADSSEALMELLREHPHLHLPGSSIAFSECLPAPGQAKHAA